ncbi:MAG TPA: T9SS type A sorting domain-containing protein, partial [Bacteroidetes bacterium]|nr:T9SS type A sorting domain-containing protein [Bacteroidota bacterium]
REAFLYNLNDKTILISSSNIYEIYEDGYEKINKTPFIEVADYLAMRYRILNNEIYYFDKDSMGRAGIVMKYNGIDNVEICNLNDYVPYFYIENLTDIVQMGNFLYVCYAYNNLLYKIDLSEKKIELIESSVIDIDDDRHNFFVDGNDIYYGTHYRFYKIENNAEPFMYDINSTDGLSKYVFKLRGKLYCLTEKKLFEIKGENLDSIFSYTRNYSSHNFIYDDDYYLNQDRKNIIFPANDSILYNFDGTSIDSLSYSEINDLRKLNYDFLLLNWNSDDIYDMRENELYNIDEFDKNEDVIGIAISKVDTAIITRSWDFTKIYKTKNKFKTVQLDTSIGYDLNVKRVSYFESGNFGILYSGKYVYFVDDKLNVSKMKDIIVPDRPQNIIQKDSFIYFFGIDPEIGHQVYKVKMKTGAVFTEDIYNSKLIIEPNPSHNYILIKDENAINAKFYIYDINGRVIQKGKNTGRINISNLSNGMYIISLQTNQNIYSGLFIKQ